jgi:N-acetylglutamate synthase-like GNAT family acetyltransferase
MTHNTIHLRPATVADLDAINQVITAAVMTWQLPERVKRLSLPSYHYTTMDQAHLDIVVAEDSARNIVGVAAWEPAQPNDIPEDQTALLLHGIYVWPTQQHHGLGTLLFNAAAQAARQHGYTSLLVKAQTDAIPFFAALGMQPLLVKNATRDYPNRMWKIVAHIPS